MERGLLRVALSLVFTLAFLSAAMAQAAAPPADVVEDALRVPVIIGGLSLALDVLTVRQGGTDKLPVALITRGANPGNPRGATTDWLRGWAHDLAHRGWLAVAVMRRGYGASDGEVADDAGNCASPDVARYLDAHADDLEAALHSVAQRPDADMGRVLAIGDSAGGAAVMALAARKAVPLAAVVNVSGGLAHDHRAFQLNPDCAAFESDLVWNFARFGATARMPTLWLYAENDSWFRPALVSRMQAAFTGSGGHMQLAMLPPFREDGHTLFFDDGGMRLLLPELDGFLRAHGLPTWDPSPFEPMLTRLSAPDRLGVQEYLQRPTEKALALGRDGGTYWREGRFTLDDARSGVLTYCKERTGADCTLAAENFRPMDPPPEPKQAQRP